MTEHSIYRVRSLRKDHGQRFSLTIPELDILPDEVVCLLGPTGAGKSTLLRILAALDAPSSGEVDFRGHRLTDSPLPGSMRRRIAMVFQRPLLVSATVAYNVQYGLRLRGRRGDREGLSDLVERLQLSAVLDQPASTLSGGQQQLVALARALAVEPDVLLLDEPTANLDPARVAVVEEVLAAERRRRAMTVIWSTHNLFQARRVADRVMLLWEGACEEIAPRTEFFECPRSPRTKAFLEGRLVY